MAETSRYFRIFEKYSPNSISPLLAFSRNSTAYLDYASNSATVIFFLMYRA